MFDEITGYSNLVKLTQKTNHHTHPLFRKQEGHLAFRKSTRVGGWRIQGPPQAGLGWKYAVLVQASLVSRFDLCFLPSVRAWANPFICKRGESLFWGGWIQKKDFKCLPWKPEWAPAPAPGLGFRYLPGLAATYLGTYLGYPSFLGEAEVLLAAAVPLSDLITLEEGSQGVQSGLTTEPRQELWLRVCTRVNVCLCV